jgi:hypothetical protein
MINLTLTTAAIASYIANLDDIEAWLADESGADAERVNALRNLAAAGDGEANHMLRCIMDNDADSLARAAAEYAA